MSDKDMRDYIITVSAAGCAPIMLRAYSTEHAHDKIQACMPGVTVLKCELRRDKRKPLLGVPSRLRPNMNAKPIVIDNQPAASPVLRITSVEDIAGV